MKSHGVIKQGQLHFALPILESRRRWIVAHEGQNVIESLTVPKMPKSNAQLGAHFGLLIATCISRFDDDGEDTSLLLRTDKPTGNKIDIDKLKDYFYEVCPIYNDDGNKIGLSDTDTAQMAKHYNDCRNFAASHWNIQIPEIDKDWKENAAGNPAAGSNQQIK